MQNYERLKTARHRALEVTDMYLYERPRLPTEAEIKSLYRTIWCLTLSALLLAFTIGFILGGMMGHCIAVR